ncbi:hypothetical protein C8A01DRAFT_18123 [Parachaetomium inaequale]|uniref:Uncharacterized protein n=1 Tax=Parachaetomium inaequale TaxID=2588326 RepID=A0AAN6PCV4_9PEZI|nr:hypothetical protein C8A01DRAFT_18123 [Parachaetomium inaequale]
MIDDHELRPLTRPVLSSKNESRPVLGPTNFDLVEELELRASSVEKIFDRQNKMSRRLLDSIGAYNNFQSLTPQQADRLISRLKDTCTLLDRIADCAATIRRGFELEPTPPFPGFGEVHLQRVIHRAHQRLIASLGPLDLALFELLSFPVMMEYFCMRLGLTAGDVHEHIKHLVAFKEVMLQNGTMAVYYSAFPDSHHHIFQKLAAEEEVKSRRWTAGERSVAPDWSPPGVLASLSDVASNTFSKKVRKIPKEHLDEMEKAEHNGPMESRPAKIWFIRRWLDTNDESLAHRPLIPEEPLAELFAWAVTQDPTCG